MAAKQLITITAEEAGGRLDRWIRSKYPNLPQARVQKLLRLGDIRLNSKKTDASALLQPGDEVKLPPQPVIDKLLVEKPLPKAPKKLSKKEIQFFESFILFENKDLLIFNKPSGLAVQGGTSTSKHLDQYLKSLPMPAKLVHRIDKDTSGILVAAKTPAMARFLTQAFKQKDIKKVYWALATGSLKKKSGKITTPIISKQTNKSQLATTLYHVIEELKPHLSWLALSPITGRMHQIRIHLQGEGVPVFGDSKYGKKIPTDDHSLLSDLPPKLHLHAREIFLPQPSGKDLHFVAPLKGHMKESWKLLEWDEDKKDIPAF